ncbi:PD40 domain-containing protein [Streptomyces sp. 2133.1]|nr:PD40 domain-containing protein [Streptomyces sp. 2133.1]PBC80220.1 WD40 repeat protein [Streptomyces sp. 2321.6]SEB66478.1 WD40 repeat [Streptomyces sp. 2133.1]
MGRPENPIDPQDGPVQRFAYELRKLREEAGAPAYRGMARRAGYSAATLSQAAAGERLPTLPVVLAYVRACGGDEEEWRRRWTGTDKAVSQQPRSPEDDTDPPYRGLSRFEPGDADLFFGRDAMTAQLAGTACRHRVTALVGASGSGKSSLLRAGLVPGLRHTDSAARQAPAAVRILTPGAHPMAHGQRLEPAAGPGETWLLVDQFEELFTVCSDDAEREAFLERLLAARDESSRLRVVLAVRADFFGHCAAHRNLAAALKDTVVLVGPMDKDQLRAAIVRPAVARGLIVERDLTARIIEDVGDEPGALPLMSHALMETWRRRRGRTLTPQAYEGAGGLHGSIARTAEDTYQQLTPDQAALARHILLRLIAPGNGTQDTHRPTARTEFATTDPCTEEAQTETDAVLNRLAHSRLLTLDDGHVRLTHEALITAWPRLHSWINDERDRIRLHRQLTRDAAGWQELDRDPTTLYRGSRLTWAEETFTGEDRNALNALESAFLDAGLAARETERAHAARAARRSRRVAAAVAVLCVLALVAGTVAVQRAVTSNELRQSARSRELAGQAADAATDQPEAALLTALAGYHHAHTVEARSALISSYAEYRANRLGGHTRDLTTLAFAPDGRTLVTASDDHTVKLWDSAGHRLLATLVGHVAGVNAIAIAPDSRTLATAADDSTVRLWGLTTHRAKAVLTGHKGAVNGVAFSRDGHTLATAGADRTVRLWNTSSHKPEHTITGLSGAINAVAFSPDGHTLAMGGDDGRTRLWNVKTHRWTATVTGHTDAVDTVVFSPDGHTLATAGNDGSAKLWTASGNRLKKTLSVYDSAAPALAFAPDSRHLVTASPVGVGGISVWDTRTGHKTATLGETPARAVAWRPDGRTVAVVATSRHAGLWDLRTHEVSSSGFFSAQRNFFAIALRPDSNVVAAAGYGKITSWDTARQRYISDFRTPDYVQAEAFTPDGRVLATATSSKTMLWSYPTGRLLATLDSHNTTVTGLEISPDGHTLAAAGYDHTVRLWNLATRHTISVLTGHPDSVQAIAFSPDGKTLASAGDDRTIQLWDVTTGRRKAILTGHTNTLFALDFSPDGKTLASAGDDRTIRLWNVASHHTRTTLTDNSGRITSVRFSPDGNTLATGGPGRTIRLWDPATHRTTATLTSYRAPLLDDPDSFLPALEFTPDSRTLISLGGPSIRLWDLNADHIATRVCQQSKANHWGELLHALPQERPCP